MTDDYLILSELVIEAEKLAAENGFARSCSRRTGSLLRSLAASADRRILEVGSGYGVGSAWLASGMRPGCELVTVERNAHQHQAVASLLAAVPGITALHCDWREALTHGDFDLIFVDVGDAKDGGCDELISCLTIGGTAVLDDFTPGPRYMGEHDERWHRWMHHPQLLSCEVLTGEDVAAVVAVRVD